MLADVKAAKWGEHASNLGSMLAGKFAELNNIPAFIVDPVTTDEFGWIARISGVPGIERKCRAHALNIKATARRAARDAGLEIEDTKFVVAHMGGGISIAALDKGRILDVNDGMLGMGPFSPERAGALPLQGVIDLVREKGYDEAKRIFSRESGFVGYFNTSSLEEIEQEIDNGNEEAEHVWSAMIYQVAKEIGAMTTALKGELTGIVLTGGMVNSARFRDRLKEYISFLAPVYVYAGEEEMQALAEGVLRVIEGEEVAKTYGVQ
jgi:butyrate kinase